MPNKIMEEIERSTPGRKVPFGTSMEMELHEELHRMSMETAASKSALGRLAVMRLLRDWKKEKENGPNDER